MRTTMLVCCFALVLVADQAPASEKLTQADLLRRLIDLDRLTTPPPPGELTGLFSSFDRASKIDDNGRLVNWHANNDYGQFIRREPDGWNVMAEMQGPGAITRFWCAYAHEQLRVMLDGQVVIDAPLADLFDGKLTPFGSPLCYQTASAGGYNCYFPIGYAKSCQVLTRADNLCYQIDYVRFAPGTQVETFKAELDDGAEAALAEVAKAFTLGLSEAQVLGPGKTGTIAVHEELKKGEKLTETIDGAGTIRAMHVSLTDRRPPRTLYALRHCILRLYWDGRERPAIEAPLVDFFGSGFDRSPYNGLVMGTNEASEMPGAVEEEGRFMYCYFPMPFAEGARIEIENLNREKIGFMLYLRVDRSAPLKDSLRFKARFRKEDPCKGLDFPVLQTAGRGRFVGCTLSVDCPRARWWGDGDHKVWIDDNRFPTYFGTGTADYFGSIIGLLERTNTVGRMQVSRRLHGVTRTAPFGKSSAHRWHTADCINFNKLIHFAIGNCQPADHRDTYYATVAYWYGEAGAKDFFAPLTPEDLTPPGLRIPYAIEIEGNVRGTGWGTEMIQKYAGGEELSGKAAAVISTSKPVLINVPFTEQRKVRLGLRVHPRRPFEKIEVRDANESTIGTVEYQRAIDGIYLIGELELTPGDNLLSVVCTGSPVLDCWIVEPVSE
ncbi:MAG TPA: glycoside hydrolase family 172 protein [Phycisphaerae bacterium]|nr:glycoside hydrolase family 172 protein [Phycisphaerae bacterium]